jgi:hypothetical protein
MSPTAYVLRQPLVARRPTRWDVRVRYAWRYPEKTVDLPAGTWLLALPPPPDGRSTPPHYRLADGRVVALDEPLTAEEVDPLTDRQALAALAAYRPLDLAIWEEWGLHVDHIDRLPPFRLIQCPLCGGTSFTTVDFAEVWCDECNARFTVRHTTGDPGFVVDLSFRRVTPRHSRYLLPWSKSLVLTLVCKNSADPLDLSHADYCYRPDCTPDQAALTDGSGSLRAGLHACAPGDLYDWSLSGWVPTGYEPNGYGSYDLIWPDGRTESWPATAFLPASGLDWDGRYRLEQAITLLTGHAPAGTCREACLAALDALRKRPSRPPRLPPFIPWPRRGELAPGEKYLLHRWVVQTYEEAGMVAARPVWLVVVDAAAEEYAHRWRVVRDNLCPHCGRPVAAADLDETVKAKRPWRTPHGACRETWRAGDWTPTLFGPGERPSTSGGAHEASIPARR